MPGRIMTAQQAAKKHKGVTKKGNKVSLKNSDGRRVTVGKNDKVYHRGKGKFGRYSATRDAKRVSRGATNLSNPVGSGPSGTRATTKKEQRKDQSDDYIITALNPVQHKEDPHSAHSKGSVVSSVRVMFCLHV